MTGTESTFAIQWCFPKIKGDTSLSWMILLRKVSLVIYLIQICMCWTQLISGLIESNHYNEIPAKTMEKIYELFAVLEEIVEQRGKDGYQQALSKLSAEFHHNFHYLLQYSAQVKTW